MLIGLLRAGESPWEKDEKQQLKSPEYVCVCLYLTGVVMGRMYEVSWGMKSLKVKNLDY